MRRRAKIGLLLGSLALSLALVEAGARVFLPETPMFQLAFVRNGWRADPFVDSTRTVEDPLAHWRTIKVRTFEHGFKRWGDIHTRKRRMLVLGDSFTYASQVGNGEEYYAFLQRAFPDWEIFVNGVSGYGSLQEYMVLDEFSQVIRPDVILWQWCNNDFANNVFEADLNTKDLRKRREFLEVNRKRPYLIGDEIVYRLPKPYASWRERFKVVDFLLDRWDVYRVERWERDPAYRDDYRRRNPRLGRAHVVRASVPITTRIFAMARERSPGVPIYLFSTHALKEPLEEVCQGAEITCVPGVAEHLQDKMSEGIRIRSADGIHWSLAGHRWVGEFLIDVLRSDPAFPVANH